MSEEALRDYTAALSAQHNRNEARRIINRVREARKRPKPASRRWPFELFQNALDPGSRPGQPVVNIRLQWDGSILRFEHDGAPFSSSDLAALLSGGSSKDLESAVTTGRFGTGFLVTHVMSDTASLGGLLDGPSGHEWFELVLDRSGNEEQILQNIQDCNEAVRVAERVPTNTLTSARFKYEVADSEVVTLGLEALCETLPYLYGTRPTLGKVEVSNGSQTEEWIPGPISEEEYGGGLVYERVVTTFRGGIQTRELRVLRFTAPKQTASAIVLLAKSDLGWRVIPVDTKAPRLYREYPLSASSFLPIGFVLDAKFEPDQERTLALMGTQDKDLVVSAFASAILAVRYALQDKWQDSHYLAMASKVAVEPGLLSEEEGHWWNEQLTRFANQLAHLPMVETEGGFLPAIAENDAFADFVIPRIFDSAGPDETSMVRFWPLVKATKDLQPPKSSVASAWCKVATGWTGLGLKLNRVTLSFLANWVTKDAKLLQDLNIATDRREWLAVFMDILGECWKTRQGIDVSILKGLVPDQVGRLHSPKDLAQDLGIPGSLKDICHQIGYEVRTELLLDGLLAENAAYLPTVLEEIAPVGRDLSDVQEAAIKHLERTLIENTDSAGDDPKFLGSLRLLAFLWETSGISAASLAKRLPLAATSFRIVRWTPDRMMMAPPRSWHESARPFSDVYPPFRVLADIYAGSEAISLPDLIPSLVSWGMAFEDPLVFDTPSELRDQRLGGLSANPAETEGIVVTSAKLSQIALLQPEVLNRCQEGTSEARALLGLLLQYIAPNDPAWRVSTTLKGRKAREEVNVSVFGALWLSDLRVRAWVPVPGEDGKPAKMVANRATLESLRLDADWLRGNDAAIELLSRWFGFDALELRLLGVAPEEQTRQELRDALAKLVETGGADKGVYQAILEEIQVRQRRSTDIERSRKLGLAVQEAIGEAIARSGLQLDLVDRGFDYEVTSDDILQSATTKLQVGSYLVEVKATTQGAAGMTPTQALTASQEKDHYALCVVDLRGISRDELEDSWTADRVEPLARVVSDIGAKVQETHSLVVAATAKPIGLRNDAALRYEVPPAVWLTGLSIGDWVKAISG